jgi:hypothetical protein
MTLPSGSISFERILFVYFFFSWQVSISRVSMIMAAMLKSADESFSQ